MQCLFCRRKIGTLRKFVDSNFCCAEHRKKYRANSARALREAEDLYGDDGELGERWRLYASQANDKPPSQASQSSAFVVAIAVAFLLFAITRGGGDSTAPAAHPGKDQEFTRSPGGLQRRIGEAIEKRAPVTIKETFSSGLAKWESPFETKPESARADGWTYDGAYVRPGKLRVWKDSESLSNYDLEFVGHVEKKSMNWAFRTVDAKNYYAAKLTVGSAKNNPLPNTGMVRYAMIDGRERDRVEVPLPINLDRETDYDVKVSVRGGRFLTSINGQLVSSWSDSRISRGGVGLFADSGEGAAFKWLSVSERDSFWGRLVSHFSIIVFPGLPPQSGGPGLGL